eukprot:Rhum_TRINITY_DN11737_c0_g2::Rhum_TRINITY_DN11737_c0_g2_i1::g.46826::m.46826/K06889/K06889; uncharacterized protein
MLGQVAMMGLLLSMAGGAKAVACIPAMYLCYLIFLWASQISFLFPISALTAPVSGPPEGVKVSWVDGEDGSSEAWFFEASRREVRDDGVRRESGIPTVCIFHGNGDFIQSYTFLAQWLVELGYNVLVPEYRGYGRSQGTPTEEDIISDMKTHIRELTSEPYFDETNLIYFGVSVGGGIASSLAVHYPPKALILLSTFYSIPSVSKRYGVPEFVARQLLHNIYDNAANLKEVRDKHGVPVFMAHGTEDTIVDYSHAERLAAHIGVDVYTRRCGHNDFHFDEEYRARIEAFLEPFSKAPLSPPSSPEVKRRMAQAFSCDSLTSDLALSPSCP